MVFGSTLLGLNRIVVSGGLPSPPTITGSTVTENQSVTTINNPETCRFVNSGSNLWVSSRSGVTFPFYRYDLSTPFDISGVTAVNYDQAFTGVVSTNPDGLDFSPNGDYFGFVGGQVLDIHSASDNKSNVGSLITSKTVTSDGLSNPRGISWVTDSIIIISCVSVPKGIQRYTWNSGSNTLTLHSTFSSGTTEYLDVFMYPDGTRLWAIDNSYIVYEYDLGTAYDITSMTLNGTKNIATDNPNVGGSVSRGIHIDYDTSNNALLFLAEDGTGDEQLHRFYIT